MKNKQIKVALISLAMKITFSQLFIVILFLGNVYAKDTKGQDVFNKSVSISAKNVELKKVLVQLENLADGPPFTAMQMPRRALISGVEDYSKEKLLLRS